MFFIYIRAINNKIIEINSNISVITKAYSIIHLFILSMSFLLIAYYVVGLF